MEEQPAQEQEQEHETEMSQTSADTSRHHPPDQDVPRAEDDVPTAATVRIVPVVDPAGPVADASDAAHGQDAPAETAPRQTADAPEAATQAADAPTVPILSPSHDGSLADAVWPSNPVFPVDPAAPTVPLSQGAGDFTAPAYPEFASYPGGVYPPADERTWITTSKRVALAQPLSRGIAALLFGATLFTVILAAGLGLVIAHGEWATSVRAAGVAALVAAVAFLVGTVLRAVVGRRGQRAVLLGLVAVVILGSLGAGGLVLAAPLRLAQAHALEASHSWSAAIHEYALTGEHGPASRDLARVYGEWGDALRRQQRYAAAVDRYYVVIATYPAAISEARHAADGLRQTISAWLASGASDIPYASLLDHLGAFPHAGWCDAPCQSSASMLAAQTHFQYGVALVAQKQYEQAGAQFEAVTTQFPASPYAARAHTSAASAYYAFGQQQLALSQQQAAANQDHDAAATCAAVVPLFAKLSQSYVDTPEGANAKHALAAPVTVKGLLSGYPTHPAPTMYLSRHISASTYFSDDYSASLDANGRFTFNRVAQGKYNLSAAFSDGHGVFWYGSSPSDVYDISVGPLCTVVLPSYHWS